MENGVERENGEMELFREEEVRDISGLKRGRDYIEVTCGCTSQRYGDAVGRLRVFLSGDLEISCECTPGCQEGRLTPTAFEKHCGKDNAKKWRNNIWVFLNDEKVPLSKTVLLKYYDQAPKNLSISGRHYGRAFHRDEFIRCSSCNKERRFRLRTKEECRNHHGASLDTNWKCSDHLDRISCDYEEERASRRRYRGCARSPTCKGCTSCVCLGCEFCRFSDCGCQICIDFTRNAGA
ncbi:Protein ULTRAPETALA 1 [Ancistrocladus abbreviatus]